MKDFPSNYKPGTDKGTRFPYLRVRSVLCRFPQQDDG